MSIKTAQERYSEQCAFGEPSLLSCFNAEITDLRAVIAEMESAEPRAWVNWSALTGQPRLGFECESEIASEPLFAHPQPKAEPVQEKKK